MLTINGNIAARVANSIWFGAAEIDQTGLKRRKLFRRVDGGGIRDAHFLSRRRSSLCVEQYVLFWGRVVGFNFGLQFGA